MGGAFRCNVLQENCFYTSPSDRDASISMKTEKVQTEWILCNTRFKMGQEPVVKGVPRSSNLNLEGGAQKSTNWDLVSDLCRCFRDRVWERVYVWPSPRRCQEMPPTADDDMAVPL